MSYLLKVPHSALFCCISMALIVWELTSGNYSAALYRIEKNGPLESTELSQLSLSMAMALHFFFFFLMDVNGGEASLRWINCFFWGNGLSFNESTAYLLIFNMFYTKQYFWIELFLEFRTGGIQFTALPIHSYGIRKRQLQVAQLLTASMWYESRDFLWIRIVFFV